MSCWPSWSAIRFVFAKMSVRLPISSEPKIWLRIPNFSPELRTTCDVYVRTYCVMSMFALRVLMSPTSTCTGERRNSYASLRTSVGNVAV